jgi:hypothetical protein
MEGFSFVMPVTGLNRPNTGKEDDDILNIQTCILIRNLKSSQFSNKNDPALFPSFHLFILFLVR